MPGGPKPARSAGHVRFRQERASSPSASKARPDRSISRASRMRRGCVRRSAVDQIRISPEASNTASRSPSGLKAIAPSSGFPTSAGCSASRRGGTSSLRGTSGRSFGRVRTRAIPENVGHTAGGHRPVKAGLTIANGHQADDPTRPDPGRSEKPSALTHSADGPSSKAPRRSSRPSGRDQHPDVAASVRHEDVAPGPEASRDARACSCVVTQENRATTVSMEKLHLAMATQGEPFAVRAEAGRPRLESRR